MTDKMIPHVIDMGEPEDTWKGYWCPVDHQFHKNGTSLFMNMHCITCKAMLTRLFPATSGRDEFTVKG